MSQMQIQTVVNPQIRDSHKLEFSAFLYSHNFQYKCALNEQ